MNAPHLSKAAIAALTVVILGLVTVVVTIASRSDDDAPAASATGQAAQAPSALVALGASADPWVLEAVTDPEDGVSYPIPGVTGQSLPATEIVRTQAMLGDFSESVINDGFMRRASYACGVRTPDYRVTCPAGAGEISAGEYLVVMVEHEGRVGRGADRLTYGLVLDDDGDPSDNRSATPPFTADLDRDSEFRYQLHIDPDGQRRMTVDNVVGEVTNHPSYSGAAVVEAGDTLVWVIPRDEVPGGTPVYRATAFHNNGPLGIVPTPGSSGGDVSGMGVAEPLLPVDLTAVPFDDAAALPDQVRPPVARGTDPADPDARVARALIRDAERRLKRAVRSGETKQVMGMVLPEALHGKGAKGCRSQVRSTLAQAESVDFTKLPKEPGAIGDRAVYEARGTIDYQTGSVRWRPALTPGGDGQLYLLLPACTKSL